MATAERPAAAKAARAKGGLRMKQRAIRVQDKLWEEVLDAVAAKSDELGRAVSVGEWVRTALETQLKREGRSRG